MGRPYTRLIRKATIASLDCCREITQRLSDSRRVSEAEAHAMIAEDQPVCWLTVAMHLPETDCPKMLMKHTYRLTAEDTPMVRAIYIFWIGKGHNGISRFYETIGNLAPSPSSVPSAAAANAHGFAPTPRY